MAAATKSSPTGISTSQIKFSENEVVRAAMELHDPTLPSITLRGKDYDVHVRSGGLRCLSIGPYEFIVQNPKKNSSTGDLARQGHKLTWIYNGPHHGLIQDGKVAKKSSLIDPKLEDWQEPTHSFHNDVVIKWALLKIESKLGNGAFGEVKKAHYRGTPVAVKMLHLGDAAQAFFQEATLLCSLRHPNIVACLGVCVTEPNLAIVMELMASNLTQIIRTGAIPAPRLIELAIGITRGILFLHNREPKVIHRDIKPENILIDTGGTPKLADFGVSKESLETMTQTKIGTPIYAAPELLNGDAYGTAIDIYSLSMVFYSMATGVTPFSDLQNGSRPHTPAQIMMKTAVKRERPIIPASVHPSLAAIIRDCWDHFPKKRPTAEQLLERLIALQTELGGVVPEVKPEPIVVASLQTTVPLLTTAPTVPIVTSVSKINAPVYESLTTHADFDWMGGSDSVPLEKRPPVPTLPSSVLVPAPMPAINVQLTRGDSTETVVTASTTSSRNTSSSTVTRKIEAPVADVTPSQIFRSGRTLRSATRAAAKDATLSASSIVASSGATNELASLEVGQAPSKTRSRAKAQPRVPSALSSNTASIYSDTTQSLNYTSDAPIIDEELDEVLQKTTKSRSKRKEPTPSADSKEDEIMTTGSLSHKKLVYQLEMEEGRRPSVWS